MQGLKAWRFTGTDRQITLFECGIGTKNAYTAAAIAIAHSPDIIISAGFCGALTSNVKTGDYFLAEFLQNYSDSRLSTPLKSDPTTFNRLIINFNPANFITVAEITNKKELAPRLDYSIGTPVVEMESSAIADVCNANGIGFAAIRSVSDSMDNDPADIFRLITDHKMNISTKKIAASILKNPAIIIKLATLGKHVKLAERSLTKAMSIALELV